MKKSMSGFTIVELLIVIVVIAILATISIIAYHGIQQRASNTKTIAAVNQAIKSISGYIAVNDAYPSVGSYCLVPAETSCTAGGNTRSASTTLSANLKTISTLPSSVPDARPEYNGIVYDYYSLAKFNDITQPLRIFYSLRGEQQQCGVSNVTNSGGTLMYTSTTGWTVFGSGYTVCVVSIPGPSP